MNFFHIMRLKLKMHFICSTIEFWTKKGMTWYLMGIYLLYIFFFIFLAEVLGASWYLNTSTYIVLIDINDDFLS